MAHFLGVGMTHYPLLAGTDEHMAGLLRWTLQDPDIPAAEKDPASWPASMRADWDGDGGTAAAARHRKALCDNLTRCREALDEFRPDLVVVWGTISTRTSARRSCRRSACSLTGTWRCTPSR